MRTMNDFSAFKLNKNQMGAMKGGIKCQVNFDGHVVTFEQEGMEKKVAENYLNEAYGWMEDVVILGCEE